MSPLPACRTQSSFQSPSAYALKTSPAADSLSRGPIIGDSHLFISLFVCIGRYFRCLSWAAAATAQCFQLAQEGVVAQGAARVRPPYRLGQRLFVLRHRHQIHVVAHQAIAPGPSTVLVGLPRAQLQIHPPVIIHEEARLPVVASRLETMRPAAATDRISLGMPLPYEPPSPLSITSLRTVPVIWLRRRRRRFAACASRG